MMLRIPALILLAAGCAIEGDTSPDLTEDPVVEAVGRCAYVNTFSQSAECKEYLGANWTEDMAEADCAAPMPGADPGLFEAGLTCARDSILGECQIGEGTDDHSVLVFPGEYGDSCDGLDFGCSFAGGEFVPSPLCDAATEGPDGELQVFRPFEQVCVDPLPGEPAGASDGDVCTWEAISGATEAGRYYADYADCSTVITQRPYWPASAEAGTASDDPRLSDTDWQAEYAWVTAQVESTACVCCHTEKESPDGRPSGWYLEAEPIWIDTLDDDGLAMMAGWVDSTAFGAFDPSDNNGFSRDQTGVPTTDPDRMKSFLEGELSRRGFERADFDDTDPFGGPLYDQLVYEPSACVGDVGLDASGTLTWTGGDARYVYVLEAQSSPPGVPPNLDLPDGTLWRMDVSWFDEPVPSGLTYGSIPEGAQQAWPVTGTAPALASGETYFLYVLADVYQPLTRCLFTAP